MKRGETVQRYLLKEHGSWGVMTIAYLSGLAEGHSAGIRSLAGFLAMALLINAKQPLTILMRAAKGAKTLPAMILTLHILLASLLLTPLYQIYDLHRLMPYAVFPAAYLLSLKLFGEHSITTEVSGFILLSLSALIAKAISGGGIDSRLFMVVAVFFVAGVFRVRIQLRRQLLYRLVMIGYVCIAVPLFYLMGFRTVLLLPLADNLLFAITLYRVGLPATGWIEMTKGMLFFLLIAAFGYR